MKDKFWWIIGIIFVGGILMTIFEHVVSWLILGVISLLWATWEFFKNQQKKFWIILLVAGLVFVAGSSTIMVGQHLTAVAAQKAAKVDKRNIAKANNLTNRLNNDSKKSAFKKASSAASKVTNKKKRSEIKATITEDKQNWIDSRKPIAKASTTSSSDDSSSNKPKLTNNQKFVNHINKLNKGTAQYARYNSSTDTVTWTGYDNWKSLSHSDLKKSMDILETITNKSVNIYKISSPKIIVKTPSGTIIAKSSIGQNLQFTSY